MLRLERVSAGYGEGDVIHEVSLHLQGGEVYVLLGPNGAGKTTTFRVVVGVLPPSSGRVEIFGSDLWRTSNIRRRIGYLPEGDKIYPQLSVRRNLLFFAKVYGVRPDQVEEVVKKFGLEKYENQDAGKLSAGFRRRLALARALLPDPDLLVLDEPFANLDLESVISIRGFLSDLLDGGKGILLSSHVTSEVQHLEESNCRVGVIVDGKIQLEAPLSEITSMLGEITFAIRVDDNERCTKILSSQGYDVQIHRGRIAVRVKNYEEVPNLISFLLSKGIKVYEVKTMELPIEELLMKFFRRKDSEAAKSSDGSRS